jgi:hypothetical protein
MEVIAPTLLRFIINASNRRQGISLSRRLLRCFLRVYLCRKYLEMGLANDAARLQTASVRQDQRKYLEMGLANDAANLEMGPGNDAGASTDCVRQPGPKEVSTDCVRQARP